MDFINNNCKVVFSDDHKQVEQVYVNNVAIMSEKVPVFVVELRDSKGDRITFTSEETKSAIIENNVISYSVMYNVSVSIEVSKGEENQLQFCPRIINHGDFAIESIMLLPVVVPKELAATGGTYKIMTPFNEGAEIEDINLRTRNYLGYTKAEYPSLGLASFFPGAMCSQFMAYYDGVKGMYFGTHDKHGNLKDLDACETETGIRFNIRMFCGVNPGDDYISEYPLVIASFNGDWYDAADIYRNWFDKNKGPEFKKIEENERIPDWYKESPVVVAYPVRGKHDTDIMAPNKLFPYNNALPVLDSYEERLKSKLMVLLMHWEGTAPWAPPYVWPPYGGEEIFGEFVDEVHKRDNVIGVYCSGLGWTQHSGLMFYEKSGEYNSKNLSQSMCTGPDGEVKESTICRGIRYGYDMCPTEDFTINTLTNEVKSISDAKVDYIQVLDQNHGGISTLCYAKHHKHPYIPGKWQTEAMNSLIDGFYEASDNKQLLFGCESASSEAFIPNLLFSDNRFEATFFEGRPIPLYSYLYHEYVNNFMGNQIGSNGIFSHDLSDLNMYYRIGYSFAAGDMGTVVMDEDGDAKWNWGDNLSKTKPNTDLILQYISKINAVRRQYPQFMMSGRAQRPIIPEGAKKVPLQMNYLTPALLPGEERIINIDNVLLGCYSNGDSHGEILINFTNEDAELSFDFDYVLYIDGQEKNMKCGEKFILNARETAFVTFKK